LVGRHYKLRAGVDDLAVVEDPEDHSGAVEMGTDVDDIAASRPDVESRECIDVAGHPDVVPVL
jgi:hypothetical protein